MLVLAAELEHKHGVTGLFTGKILTLRLENLFESSCYARSFLVVLVTKRL